MGLPPDFGQEIKNTNQKPFARHSETQLTSTIHWGTFDRSSGLPCIFWRIRCRDGDFKDVTETEKSSFCIQRINKIGKLQASETMEANKVASKSTANNTQAIKVQAPLSKFKHLFKFGHLFDFFFCVNDFNARSGPQN
jgi:hypothetical protein